jgi:glycosyltransferase involved in cell wall biosynthesis
LDPGVDNGFASAAPRIAFFPDSFHEVNGVAHTSRHFEAFARRHTLPFLCIRAGDRADPLRMDQSVWTLELPRSFLSFPLEKDLRFDPAYLRHIPLIEDTLTRFKPDLVHITGPSEIGMLGAGLSHTLDVPLAASWHTNVHEYAARRMQWLFRRLPQTNASAAGQKIEETALAVAARFYATADVLFAPNRALCELLEGATGRPCRLMPRGVDAELFSPRYRTRSAEDKTLVLGYVGRLSVEKNVELLAAVQSSLERLHGRDFRFMIVGHGAQEAWLREHMPGAEFTGVLKGRELSEAYANMDMFVFPSHTDTFGNVVLEALASGVPAVVTPDGGPCTIVRDFETGRVVPDEMFAEAIASIAGSPAKLAQMRKAARAHALNASWDAVFQGVYGAYDHVLGRVVSAE